MRFMLDILALHLHKEMLKQRGNANKSSIWRKGELSSPHCASTHFRQAPVSRAIGNGELDFGQANDTTWTKDALTFTHQLRPVCFRNEAADQASIDQVKGAVGIIKWLKDISDSKVSIVQSLDRCHGTRVFDHRAADINARGLYFWILERNVTHPTTRATTDIKNIVHAGEAGVFR